MRQSMYKRLGTQHPTRGFTMLELIVASAISVFVFAGVMALQYLSARTAQELYGPTDSRTQRMKALNRIRLALVEAKVGSCVVSDSSSPSGGVIHGITFVDPNLQVPGRTVTSEFRFVGPPPASPGNPNPGKGRLYYNPDTASGSGTIVARGPINILFTLGTTDLDYPNHTSYVAVDSCVTLYVLTEATLAYSKVDTRDGETVVYLRNLAHAL